MNRSRTNRSLVAPLIGLMAAVGVTVAANQVSAGEGPAERQHVLSPAGDVTALPYSWHLGNTDATHHNEVHHTVPQHVWSGG